MKHLFRGSVVLAAAVGFLSCSGDPTSSLREPEGITASPTTVFINVGESKPVIVSLLDDQGNQIAADFQISDVGAGVSVVQDTAFQHTTVGISIPNQVQFIVSATAIANSSFTLTAGGKSLVIPVKVTPSTVELGISNPAPAFGDTITLTAPPGALFTDSSVVTFGGGPPADIVSLSADRTQLVIVPGPNTSGAVTVTHTTVAFDETLDFTVTSIGTVTSPTLTEINTDSAGAGSLSTNAPALGAPVTLTLPPGIRVIPESALALNIQGNTQGLTPANITVSADSGAITFIPAPNSDSTVIVPGIIAAPLPQFPQTLVTTGKITTTFFDSIAVAISNTAPAVLQPITVTPPAGFHFDTTAGLVFGALTSIVQSIAAGGTSATFVPLPGSAGHPLVTGLIVNASPLFVLHLPATLEVTVPPVTPQVGTEDPATAPELVVPGVGGSTSINDAGTFDYAAPILGGAFGTFPARLYKITAATAVNLTVTLDWPTDEDLGVYYFLADGTTEPAAGNPADNGGAGAHPETSTSSLPAGTYLLAVVNFSTTNPPVFTLTISR